MHSDLRSMATSLLKTGSVIQLTPLFVDGNRPPCLLSATETSSLLAVEHHYDE
jgi:hypothetical protein